MEQVVEGKGWEEIKSTLQIPSGTLGERVNIMKKYKLLGEDEEGKPSLTPKGKEVLDLWRRTRRDLPPAVNFELRKAPDGGWHSITLRGTLGAQSVPPASGSDIPEARSSEKGADSQDNLGAANPKKNSRQSL